jgi:hypothetical protein
MAFFWLIYVNISMKRPTNKYRHIISLGKDCQVATYLGEKYGIPHGSLLDNVVSDSLCDVIKLLNENFESYFSKDSLLLKGRNVHGCDTVIDGSNNIISVHDFISGVDFDLNCAKFYEAIGKKKSMLMMKLRKSGSVLFIRTNQKEEPLENTVRLVESIRGIRGDLPFDVVVFQRHALLSRNLGVPNLYTFYCDDWFWNGQKWQGNEQLWSQVFEAISLQNKPNTILL